MNDQEIDRLLEQASSGDSPAELFRARALRDSTAAFVRARRGHAWWRSAPLSAAAVFIAAMSFLLGRYSAPQPTARPAVADAPDTVAVPTDMVVWVDAARLFKQLGMEDRMNRALDCAGKLLPRDAGTAAVIRKRTLAIDSEGIGSPSEDMGPSRRPDRNRPVERMNRIMANSLGGHNHEDGMD